MKRKSVIILMLIAVMIAVICFILLSQRSNLKALILSQKYTYEELHEKLDESSHKVRELVESDPGIRVRELNEDEKEKLRSGELDEDEAVALITSGEDAESAEEEAPPSPENEGYKDGLSRLIARVYVLRDTYEGRLDGMMAKARAEYSDMSDEQRSKTGLIKWVNGYMSAATSMEKECDREIDAIINQMEKLVKGHSEDEALPDAVFEAYLEEKSIKKSLYLSELEKRGLL